MITDKAPTIGQQEKMTALKDQLPVHTFPCFVYVDTQINKNYNFSRWHCYKTGTLRSNWQLTIMQKCSEVAFRIMMGFSLIHDII